MLPEEKTSLLNYNAELMDAADKKEAQQIVIDLVSATMPDYIPEVKAYARYIGEESHVIVVRDDQPVPIGCLVLSVHNKKCANIDYICVKRRHRGLGIARQMVILAGIVALYFGKNEIRVQTDEDNVVARQFYEACGFELLGIYKGRSTLVPGRMKARYRKVIDGTSSSDICRSQ